jgi:hypothetical protein
MTNLNNTLQSFIKNIPKDKLLAPIVYNDAIIENILSWDFILSSLPDNNKVKIYLINELINIIIYKAELGNNFTDIYKDIIKIGNYHHKEYDLKIGIDEVKAYWKTYITNKDIIHNEYNYNNTFVFKCNNAFLKSSLLTQQWEDYKQMKNKKPKLEVDDKLLLNKTIEVALSSMCGRYWKSVTTYYNVNKGKDFTVSYSNSFDIMSCCYAILFNNNLYYYIGSTTNIKDRVKNHHSNIQKIIHKVIWDGFYYNHDAKVHYNSNILEYFIASEILNGKINIDYTIIPVYFCTNYLKKFANLNPDYKLSKGEWILLTSITELIIKILEQSLIVMFKPKLNMVNNVTINHFDWNDNFLEEYSNERSLIAQSKEYSMINKFLILIPHIKKISTPHYYKTNRQKYMDLIVKEYNNYIDIKDISSKRKVYFTKKGPYSLYQISKRYNLNREEVLENLNKLHNYEECILLKQPIIIIPEP